MSPLPWTPCPSVRWLLSELHCSVCARMLVLLAFRAQLYPDTPPHIRKQRVSTQECRGHSDPLTLSTHRLASTHSTLYKHTQQLAEYWGGGLYLLGEKKKTFLGFEKQHHYITMLHKSHTLHRPLRSSESGGNLSCLLSCCCIHSYTWLWHNTCSRCGFKHLIPVVFLYLTEKVTPMLPFPQHIKLIWWLKDLFMTFKGHLVVPSAAHSMLWLEIHL